MDFVDLLLNVGVAVGCVIGICVAVALHMLFPAEDLLFVQALIVVLFAGLGLVFQLKTDPRNRKDR
jgi:hypothetical protein